MFEALQRMAAAGYATHHTGPHRFQITPAGIDAAGTLPPPAPATRPAPAAPADADRRAPGAAAQRAAVLPAPARPAAPTSTCCAGCATSNIPVLLYGPPGTGKTAMVEAAFPDLLTVAGTGDTVVDDFVGSLIPNPDGGYDYVYGPLVVAMREGRPLLIDDATLIPPRVLAVLYPVMDGRGVITLPAYRNEHVDAVDGFYVIAGHNPGVHGAVLTEALASRFRRAHRSHHRLGPRPPPRRTRERRRRRDRPQHTNSPPGPVGWAPQLRELLGFAHVRENPRPRRRGRQPRRRRPRRRPRRRHRRAHQTHFGTDITALRLGQQR